MRNTAPELKLSAAACASSLYYYRLARAGPI
jgi:hypothetical protein